MNYGHRFVGADPGHRPRCGMAWAWALGWALTAGRLAATTLSDPAVDEFNVRIGTQTFAGLYRFSTNTLLVESAQAIRGLGSDILKFYLGSNYPRQYGITLPAGVTNLLTLARDEPSCRYVLDQPFRHYILWAYPFSNGDAAWSDGYSAAERANDYRELYDLSRYLLVNYNGSGKRFYLGHWEGDGYLAPWTTNAPPTRIRGMIDWLNNRQGAIDDAKRDTPHANVEVFGYAEVNRVRDAMLNGNTNNQRVVNAVLPYVTNLDYVSYSSYDAMNLGPADLDATLGYLESKVPTNKSGVIPGERLWIGEYGWGYMDGAAQEPLTRAYLQRLLNFGSKAMPYLLFWEVYNNEPNREFWLIDSNQVQTACYHLHARFINQARLRVAQFKERQGRLPSDAEFVAAASPLLDQSLPAPVPLVISNLEPRVLSGSSAALSAWLAQGVYGDDAAECWIFWGHQDGGSERAAWEAGAMAGINHRFNSTAFTVLLSNLTPQTTYYFRGYATNAHAQVWTTASNRFTTGPDNSPLVLAYQVAGNQVILVWPAGILQSAGQPSGPYQDQSGATAPYEVRPAEAPQFFRVLAP